MLPNILQSMETILSSFDLLSHPDRTLAEHLHGCGEASRLQLSFKHIVPGQFFTPALLEQMRHLLVYFHDFGKGTDYFALKIIEAIEKELKEPKPDKVGWQAVKKFADSMRPYLDYFDKVKRPDAVREVRRNPNLGNHAQQGAYFVLAAFEYEDIMLRFILLKIILKHHGNLSNFWVDKKGNSQIYLEEDQVELLEKQFARLDFDMYQKILNTQGLKVHKSDWGRIKELVTDSDQIDDERLAFEDKRDIRYFFLQHFLFSLLLSADKGDVKLPKYVPKSDFIRENGLLPEWLIEKYKVKKFGGKIGNKLNDKREEAYQLVAENCRLYAERNFFSITLPTGMGKTFTAYNVAIILQNEYAKQTGGKKPRIVYCLPFTSIIDQNAAILDEILALGKTIDPEINENWLSKNHYLSTYNQVYHERALENQEPEYLTDGWEHEIIVTTFVQMLESIFTNRNSALRKFHNMTNAIFILDEVQNVPPKYYEAIERVFREMASYFNTKFVFVTATQPFLFKDKDAVLELTIGKTEEYFRQLTRIKIDQSLLRANDYQKMDAQVFLETLVADIRENGDKSFLIICNTIAQSRWFFDALEEIFTDAELIYLSSSLLPPVRRWNIRRIKSSKKRKIVVSTQVVEAGVDIDLDVVYRDFAPIDSINQSAGRCNRNDVRGTGVVKLFNLGKHTSIYDSVLMNTTREVLLKYEDEILEGKLFNLNNDYAAAVRSKVTNDSNESQVLIQAMEKLQLELIEEKFSLIEEDHRHYNVFLPCSLAARKAWDTYLNLKGIDDPYERKTKMKNHQPKLLQYITRFPKKKYEPDNPDEFLIYEPNWARWYDLDRGFKLDLKDETIIIF
jgi:CRISPR-associated endonuclease/helicase Cas3